MDYEAHCKSEALDCWNFYPLYDWRTEDDWTAVARYGLLFNEIYELMNKNGVPYTSSAYASHTGMTSGRGLTSSERLSRRRGKRSWTAWRA